MEVKELVERRDKLRQFASQCEAQTIAARGALMECEFLLGEEMKKVMPEVPTNDPQPDLGLPSDTEAKPEGE